ncbi:MAG: cupin domain-containing protein [Planctomycetes bacterium]|nr:cupin domain-containing protein [Planctomycetota bacterium]
MNEKTIGENIRRLRLKKGVTLTQAAEQAGLTKSTLSKIETGSISPPISTVLRIADALGAPMAEFFAEGSKSRHYVVTRKGKGTPIVRDGSQFGYAYEALALDMPAKKAEPFILTIKPTDPPATFQHGGDEFMYILSGKMEFTIAGESTVLNPGDSVYFNPREKHSARALGKKPVRYLDIFMQDSGEAMDAGTTKV